MSVFTRNYGKHDSGVAFAARTGVSGPLARRTPALVGVIVALLAGLSAAVPGAALAAAGDITIGSGIGSVQDSQGTWYSAAQGFIGGRTWSTGAATPILGTSDDALYRSEWVGMSAFRQPVSAGTYDVTLKMAEIYYQAPGQRVFSVKAEGADVLKDIDIFSAVGRDAAYDRTFRVTVSDGTLDLGFSASRDMPKVSAVKIVRVGDSTAAAVAASAPVAAPAPTGGRPGPSNTGVPWGTRLTPYYGNLTITTPGATYDALDIHGFVSIQAPNVRITRSIIRGGVATGNIGLVTNYDTSATGFLLEDSELVPEHPSVWIDGIKGGNFTIRRVDSWGTTDNVKIHGNNVTVDSSWLHGTVYQNGDPNQGGGYTHNDAVQILGGRNLRIVNSTLEQGHNSAVQVTQDVALTTDTVISRNWLDGGGCTVNLSNKGQSWMSGITVNDNRFGRHQQFGGCAMIVTRSTSLNHWNNVWDDNSVGIHLTDGG